MKTLAILIASANFASAQIFYNDADWERFLDGQRQAAAAAAWQREVDDYNAMRRRELEAWGEYDRLTEQIKERNRQLRELERERFGIK